jgi:leucyl-tRNA synthetase
VAEEDLPVLLPDDLDFTPHGQSPLAKHEAFVNVDCPSCGGPGRRETDTMDTFVDSSWYFLRYTSPEEQSLPFSPQGVERWMPVDHYTGGINHAILHLLYARFLVKALYDLGLVKFLEPFTTLLNQGMVIWEGRMFSKSRGVVVEPSPLIERWGADSIRLAMMFAAPVEDDLDWATVSVAGVHKWLGRVWRVVHEVASRPASPAAADESLEHGSGPAERLRRAVHRTIKEVTADHERVAYNVAISRLMVLTSEVQDAVGAGVGTVLLREAAESLVSLMAPMAPHVAEELWREALGHPETVVFGPWPQWDEDLARDEEVTMVVQVNGKVRDRITVGAAADEEECRTRALASPRVQSFLAGRGIDQVIVRAPKLVNLVVRP